MIDTLLDAMTSLTALMEEESAKLSAHPWVPDLAEIASAKLRLTGQMDAEIARLKREHADWTEQLTPEQMERLAEASRALRDASALNADVLSRQIELSVEMMAAIAAEAQRLTGARPAAYGALGGIAGSEGSAPIAINTRL